MSSSSPDTTKFPIALRYALVSCVVLLVFGAISWLFVVTKPTPPTQEELNARERLKIRAEVEESAAEALAGEAGSVLAIAQSMNLKAEHLLQEKMTVFIAEEIPVPEATQPASKEAQAPVEESADEGASEGEMDADQESSSVTPAKRPALAVANAAIRNSAVKRTLGEQVYFRHCALCHMNDGSGRFELHYPPLKDSEWLLQPVDVLARIILHGLSGPIEVRGVSYGEAMMTNFAYLLDDEEIAAVLNYVRESFAPQPDLPLIEAAQVAQVRTETLSRDPAKTWTYAELKPFLTELAN